MAKDNPTESAEPQASRDARRTAAAVLEVLAGVRSPNEAAEALGVSPPRYYTLEARALEGLVTACEPRPRGPSPSPQKQIDDLEKQVAQLQRDLARMQALARTAQRTIGLAAVNRSKPKASDNGNGDGKTKRRRRKPAVRALKAARRLGDTTGPLETSVAEADGRDGS